jgi:hypothetical protein
MRTEHFKLLVGSAVVGVMASLTVLPGIAHAEAIGTRSASILPSTPGATTDITARSAQRTTGNLGGDSSLNAWVLVAIGVFLIANISQRRGGSMTE